jgi:hypothetical protein
MIAGMTRAQPLGEKELEPLRRLVENVSIGAGLAVTPEVRLVDDAAPNAFAAGLRPEKSYVGVTTGLLRAMPKRELEAVIAHEISHIRNRDTYLMTMATVFAGVIALIADIAFARSLMGALARRRTGHRTRDRGLHPRAVRCAPAADEPLEAARIPCRRGCRRDPQRSGMALALPARARFDISAMQTRRYSTSGSRAQPTESTRTSRVLVPGLFNFILLRIGSKHLRGGRFPASRAASDDKPFSAEPDSCSLRHFDVFAFRFSFLANRVDNG